MTRSARNADRRAGLPVTPLSVVIVAGLLAAGAARGESFDAAAIGKAAGTEARTGPDGVVRIGWLRTHVAVTVDGARLDPAAGPGAWAAFKPAPGGAMVMGDTLVFEDEISPALDAALDTQAAEETSLQRR